jgi:hypothetical protein
MDANDAGGAVAYAEALVAASDHETNVKQLRATAYTDGGLMLARRDLVEKGAELWQRLGPDASPHIAYNFANAQDALWKIALKEKGPATAWQDDREWLRRARETFERVGADQHARAELRANALTNAGNSFDDLGRDLNALRCYDDAIAIDSSFGMAHGNRGKALLRMAPFMGEHARTVLRQAALALDAALACKESVVRYGGAQALASFEAARAKPSLSRIPPDGEESNVELHALADPYLTWCLRNGLFLHVSHGCIREETHDLDAVFFRGLVTGLSDEGRSRTDELVDAFNAIKRDYISARYSVWLAMDSESLIRDHAREMSERVRFCDTLSYGRFGVRTGLAVQALASAVDMLDKIASFVHLYLATGRAERDVYFSSLAWEDGRRRRSPRLGPEIAAAISDPERNRGLLALCDLSLDLSEDTPLRRLVGRRHAATHRFLVVHAMMTPESTKWLEPVSWEDLKSSLLEQLEVARGAIVYLARMIDIHEAASRENLKDDLTVTFPIERADTTLEDWE